MSADPCSPSAAPATVYLICFACEDGYQVDSVWSSESAAIAYIRSKRWEGDVACGMTWIDDQAVRDV